MELSLPQGARVWAAVRDHDLDVLFERPALVLGGCHNNTRDDTVITVLFYDPGHANRVPEDITDAGVLLYFDASEIIDGGAEARLLDEYELEDRGYSEDAAAENAARFLAELREMDGYLGGE